MRATIFVALFACGLGGVSAAAEELPETSYQIAPWAMQAPVNLTARFQAVQSAVSQAQSAVNSYSAALQAQTDAQNKRLALQREYDLSYLDQQAAMEKAATERRPAPARPTSPTLRNFDISPRFRFHVGPTEHEMFIADLGDAFFQNTQMQKGWINYIIG